MEVYVTLQVEDMYKNAHAAIRADPSPKPAKPKAERKEGEKQKRYDSSLP